MPGLGGLGGTAGGTAGSGGGASGPDGGAGGSTGPARLDPSATYRTIEQVYAGPAGFYRGCGPNGGVCHNGREYPDLRTLGALLANIDQPCNQKRDTPTEVHDLCERAGDLLRSDGTTAVEIGWVEALEDGDVPRRYRLRVRAAIAEDVASTGWRIVRPLAGRETDYLPLTASGIQVALDPADPTRQTLIAVLPPPPMPTAEDPMPYDLGADLAVAFKRAGQHADPDVVQVGDPNRNGTFGASLGGRLIKPGQSEKSYLMKRLTDPTFGPIMPRANCCYWTKDALRATYCWMAGLHADGANALEPIDYASCPDGPLERVRYPEPGPSCEISGLCPVEAEGVALPDEPTFSNLYRNVFLPGCSGSFCHVDRGVAGLDMRTADAAYRDLRARVVPGNAMQSRLYQRLDPAQCQSPSCARMPLDRRPLAPEALALVARWIQAGALHD